MGMMKMSWNWTDMIVYNIMNAQNTTKSYILKRLTFLREFNLKKSIKITEGNHMSCCLDNYRDKQQRCEEYFQFVALKV